MCRSKAEGGQRCYSHAAAKVEAANNEYQAARRDYRAASRAADRNPNMDAAGWAALEEQRQFMFRKADAHRAVAGAERVAELHYGQLVGDRCWLRCGRGDRRGAEGNCGDGHQGEGLLH